MLRSVRSDKWEDGRVSEIQWLCCSTLHQGAKIFLRLYQQKLQTLKLKLVEKTRKKQKH